MREKVKALWRLCFDDSEAFIDLYFRLRWNENVNKAITKDGKLIAALQMLPYQMTFFGNLISTSYISGACTHPDYRKKGYMKELISSSFKTMLNDKIAFSVLIPAGAKLYEYYAHLGYATVFYYTKYSVSDQLPPDYDNSLSIDRAKTYHPDVYSYLSSMMNNQPCYIQHTEEDLKIINADLTVSGGGLYYAQKGGKIVGTAIVNEAKEEKIILELFANNKEIENSLYQAISNRFKGSKVSRILPVHDSLQEGIKTHQYGMARIIDAPQVLEIYAKRNPDKKVSLKITDELLPANNGFYLIENGFCSYNNKHQLSKNFIEIGIRELTSRILLPLHPGMSLMMD
ncbi:MAG: GNAT family N-acetyltransferase [Parabacteroides sp.]